jgi:alpha-beta hydrolase superfamily lysophospholipase
MKSETFISSTGAKLNLYSLLPIKDTKAIIHIAHGMVEHANRYSRFADELCKSGYAVYSHDIRGHGQTEAKDAPQGVLAKSNGFQVILKDQNDVMKLIKERHPNKLIVCFGHSLGSIINLNFAIRYPEMVNGLACWNSGIETGILPRASRIILSIESFFRDPNLPSLIAWKLSFGAWNAKFKPNRTDFDWLSQDKNEVDLYVKDPLCGFEASISMWRDILDGVFFAGNKKNLRKLEKKLPVHIVGGSSDPCTNNGKDMKQLAIKLKNNGLTDVKCTILEATRHESLNEINRVNTTKEFIDWLDSRF